MRILFIHNHLTSFVKFDLDNLRSAFEVTEVVVNGRWQNPATAIELVRSHDLVFGRFASWHTFIPFILARWLKKPSIMVTGGYDLAKLPDIGYGNQRGGFKRWVTNKTLRASSVLVINSRFSVQEAVNHAGINMSQIRIVPDGIPDPFGFLPQKAMKPLILTVGNVEKDNLLRKGHRPYAQTAAILPDHRFVLAGRDKDGTGKELLHDAKGNLELTGWLSQEELLDYFRQAWVYVQPSLHESFGISVAEAMLAGCIPVVSPYGALPEVAGDTGIITLSTEPEEVANGIRRALEYTQVERQRTRQRVLDCFPMEKRRKALVSLCVEVVGR